MKFSAPRLLLPLLLTAAVAFCAVGCGQYGRTQQFQLDQASTPVGLPSSAAVTGEPDQASAPVGLPSSTAVAGEPDQAQIAALAQAALSPPPAKAPVQLLLVGDIMLDRVIGDQISRHGFTQPFEATRDFISAADIAFANLESPASFLGSPAFSWKPELVTFRADPGSLIGLKYAGFDIVSLANNHTTDYGRDSLTETMELLQALEVDWVGAGRNKAEARQHRIVQSGGVRIAFLAYSEFIGAAYEATETRTGVAVLRLEEVLEDLQLARAARPDYIFISLHWGEEYKHYPLKKQETLARHLIDAGADGIIGHHSHALHGIEIYKNRPIIYSLGNFIFDMPWDYAKQSMAVSLHLGGQQLQRLEVTPLYVQSQPYRPVPVSGEEAERIMDNIELWSEPFGTGFAREIDRLVYTFDQYYDRRTLARSLLPELAR